MQSSYHKEDVILLLKDITGLVTPLPTKEREKRIQAGTHYSEMLPLEYQPSEKYMQVYQEALETFSISTAKAVIALSQRILLQRGKNIVFVSLARAGIPIGILLRRYLLKKYQFDIPHYAISIIRDRGIDANAMQYLLSHHSPNSLVFVDGWIGKGAIYRELQKEIAKYPEVNPEIAVLSDPAYITRLYGTQEDILIPSSCLNSTISGLISRTFLRSDIIGEHDYHGAVYYGELKDVDLSYEFIHRIESEFYQYKEYSISQDNIIQDMHKSILQESSGLMEVMEIAKQFQISDINFIKPGIGETTRVLLRRVPQKILIQPIYMQSKELQAVLRLAIEKQVPVQEYPLKHYKCCGIIQKLGDI